MAITAPSTTAKEYFGQELFNSTAQQAEQHSISQNYVLSRGDIIKLQITGAIKETLDLTIDPNGNIAHDHFGTIPLAGIQYKELQSRIRDSFSKLYNKSVKTYAYIDANRPIQVMVSGHATEPGVYDAKITTSPLSFLSKSGVNLERGTLTDIQHIRDGKVIAHYNLFKYITSGILNSEQFKDGDSLHIPNKQGSIFIDGDARFNGELEVTKETRGSEVLVYGQPLSNVTHVRVTVLDEGNLSSTIYTIEDFDSIILKSGNQLTFISDYTTKTVGVKVAGEHNSKQMFNVNKGTSIEELLLSIEKGPNSSNHVQLFRESVKTNQKTQLLNSLKKLEKNVLTTSSTTTNTANLRLVESELALKWIASAREIEPKGQVIIEPSDDLSRIILEEGDTIIIPKKNNIIQIHGEVNFPSATTYKPNRTIEKYLSKVGGAIDDSSKIFILKQTGEAKLVDLDYRPNQGDEIFVLPAIDNKNYQFAQDMTQILYQIAASAAVVLGI